MGNMEARDTSKIRSGDSDTCLNLIPAVFVPTEHFFFNVIKNIAPGISGGNISPSMIQRARNFPFPVSG